MKFGLNQDANSIKYLLPFLLACLLLNCSKKGGLDESGTISGEVWTLVYHTNDVFAVRVRTQDGVFAFEVDDEEDMEKIGLQINKRIQLDYVKKSLNNGSVYLYDLVSWKIVDGR